MAPVASCAASHNTPVRKGAPYKFSQFMNVHHTECKQTFCQVRHQGVAVQYLQLLIIKLKQIDCRFPLRHQTAFMQTNTRGTETEFYSCRLGYNGIKTVCVCLLRCFTSPYMD